MHRSTLAALAGACLVVSAEAQTVDVRFASFNAFLNRSNAGDLIADVSAPGDPQIAAVAEILQRKRPDVVLLNELDYDAAGQAVALFQQNYLGVPQNGAEAIDYPFVYLAESNTGIPSGFDLDNNGVVGTRVGTLDYGNDSFGFGFFPGQFAMVLLSRYPIDTAGVRTFQTFLWRDMPGALLPDDPATGTPGGWYSPGEQDVVRLSSKSHWDVPVVIEGQVVHLLCAHPTPPVFDGPEDRNGRRNHDEIRFWADYATPGLGGYIYDDEGGTGGLGVGERFVIVGDYNADPTDGDGVPGAIQQLLDSPRVQDTFPAARGGFEAAVDEAGVNLGHVGNPTLDSANFTDVSPFFTPSGNLRVDYCLPSAQLPVIDSGVFWPGEGDPLFRLVGRGDPGNGGSVISSDHRLVYVDVRLVGSVPNERTIDLSSVTLEFIGEDTIPTGTVFQGTEVGGLSALVFDPASDQYFSLCDDRSQVADARFYSLQIDLADDTLDPGEVVLRRAVTLEDAAGAPFASGAIDPEGLTLVPGGTFYLSSEGDANAAIDPFVDVFSVTGRQTAPLPVPFKYITGTPDFGIRNNLAFESLTLSPSGATLFTATENALFQDGMPALVNHGSPCRILSYDVATGQPADEFIYWTDEIAAPPVPPTAFATNGLVELLAVDEDSLIAMERSFSVGVGNAIKLYAVDLPLADDVRGVDVLARLIRSFAPVRKTLLFDLDALGITLDNVEGMTLGPRLSDGRRTLILVSDNNFNPTQFTQFLAFAINEL
ncbi:MAG: esterase-like activity of phytase family protein [Planctomycetota bacterium]